MEVRFRCPKSKGELAEGVYLELFRKIIGGEFLRFLELYRAIEKGKVPDTIEEWYCLSGLILGELRKGKLIL